MKIKNKILLGITAASGVIASFGAAFALYIHPANGDQIGIGIGTVQSYSESEEDGVQYSFGKKADVTGDEKVKTAITVYSDDTLATLWATDQKLDPAHNKVYIKAPISFYYTYDTGKTALTAGSEQSYAAGTLKVNVTVNEEIAKKGNVAVTAKLAGYNYEKLTADNNYFMAKKEGKNFMTSQLSSAAFSATSYVDTGVADDGQQYCLVTLDFSSVIKDENDAFLDVSNITNAFTVTFNWGNYSTDGRTESDNIDKNLDPNVFVRGDKSSWKDFGEYRMVPNLKNDNAYGTCGTEYVEWMYKDLTGFSKIKVKDNSISQDDSGGWISYGGNNVTGVTAEDGGNASLTKDGYKYGVYYVRKTSASGNTFSMDSTSVTQD